MVNRPREGRGDDGRVTHVDTVYREGLQAIINKGRVKGDRTGTGTISYFGLQMEFDLSQGFPLLDSKKVPFNTLAHELIWFINGDTNLKTLLDNNVKIWTDDGYRNYLENFPEEMKPMTKEAFVEYVKEFGYDLGAIYGEQWRAWHGYGKEKIDQLQEVIDSIRNNPDSRRHIVSAWNPADIKYMTLPPCHTLFQFYVCDGVLDCKMYQRSADFFLGVPFNIASYALLVMIVAKMTGLKPGRFIHTFGDAHIYLNHLDAVKEQLSRTVVRPMPKLEILNVHERIEDYTLDDFKLTGYKPQPTIKAPLSVGL
jgi:thymidylate synthase